MKRLKYLFAGALLFLALPVWRYIDVVSIVAPFNILFSLSMILWSGLFLIAPLKLIFPNFKTPFAVLILVLYGALSWWSGPLSVMATTDSTLNHCGPLTFTGTVYPLRKVLTEAYRDDLEVRNQMCWIRKMIQRVPESIQGDHEIQVYSKIIENKLLLPEIKYKATLPLIAYLFIKINTAGTNFTGAKNIYNHLHFWVNHYTEEISNRDYSWWNWPHSEYIQFEYGLLEKNWQSFVDGIEINK